MRVHINYDIATPRGVFHRGEITELNPEMYRKMVKSGAATPVKIWLQNLANKEGFEIVKTKKKT